MLRRTLDGMGDDDQEAGVKDPEHDHIDDQNDGEVGVEYMLTKERKEMLVESIVDEETSQETQDPLVRKRKPSERYIKIKLKKAVHDPDGGRSTTDKALTLDRCCYGWGVNWA
ncbi:unnamed protein product [Lactuca virosa]|uniref:Uncharacterized protein n=1 Tax=Lactuca virosa TaxID=75947 RepID=A0AAU9LX13_9ASTR|nr:unnamed protein product [Lactuca virosa]